jgi:hypothetical protein
LIFRIAAMVAVIAASVAVIAAQLPAGAQAEPTRSDYVIQVDPLCAPAATRLARVILRMDSVAVLPVAQEVSEGIRRRTRRLGRSFTRLGGSLNRLAATLSGFPPPSADAASITSWLGSIVVDSRASVGMGRLLERGQLGRFSKRSGRYLAHIDQTTEWIAAFGFNYCAFSTTTVPWWK